jgi:hypothetical protein
MVMRRSEYVYYHRVLSPHMSHDTVRRLSGSESKAELSIYLATDSRVSSRPLAPQMVSHDLAEGDSRPHRLEVRYPNRHPPQTSHMTWAQPWTWKLYICIARLHVHELKRYNGLVSWIKEFAASDQSTLAVWLEAVVII